MARAYPGLGLDTAPHRPPCTPASRHALLAGHCGARCAVPCLASGLL